MIKHPKLFIFLTCAFAVGIEILAAWIIYAMFERDWQKASNFGESFGAVNALFSGLALAGVVYTLILQRKALDEQQIQYSRVQSTDVELRLDREKNYLIFSKQVNELSKAAEIQAIQLQIRFLDEEYQISPQKKEILVERNMCKQRLREILNIHAR